MAKPIKLFINYRRDDEFSFVESLHLRLQARYGEKNVFMDVEKLPLFSRFDTYIVERVREADILVVVIGPHWVETLSRRAALGETDFVKLEIEEALRNQKVIAPICIADTSFPSESILPESLKPIARLNAAMIKTQAELRQQFDAICRRFDQLIEEKRKSESAAQPLRDPQEIGTKRKATGPLNTALPTTVTPKPFPAVIPTPAPQVENTSITAAPISTEPTKDPSAVSSITAVGTATPKSEVSPSAAKPAEVKVDPAPVTTRPPIPKPTPQPAPTSSTTYRPSKPSRYYRRDSRLALGRALLISIGLLVLWLLISWLNDRQPTDMPAEAATAAAAVTMTSATSCVITPARSAVVLYEDPTSASRMVTAVEPSAVILPVGRREVVGAMWYYVAIRTVQGQYFDGWLQASSVNASPPCNSLVIDTLH